VTEQCADSIITSSSTHGKDTVLTRRNTWTVKILSATDDRLQQEDVRVLTPLYKEIGVCFMGDGWQSTSNAMMISRQQKVVWDSQTHISEPDQHTNEQGVDDADDDDIDSDCITVCQDQH
jgi:hypothetical protein